MTKNLLIVESPAKSKTLSKYLGKDFTIRASFGHVRDLIPKEGAVVPSDDFAMHYDLIERNKKHVDTIVKEFKSSDALYLATDPDREGEAISWHIHEILKNKKLLKDKPIYRVAFHEITKKAVNQAIENPREISMHLVNAQQARRALDYLVGFNLSPLLWKKIRRGLSAGRVQSPALRLIVEREIEIEKFVAEEYWTIKADCNTDEKIFHAKLYSYEGKKLKQFDVNNHDLAHSIVDKLHKLADGKLKVISVDKKQRKRNPAAPFITSTLQQEAIRKLGFSAAKTMRVAQQLYEGIDIGEGSMGLITYMRTDSVSLADEAITEIRDLIVKKYGKENLPDEAKVYKTKSKNAQEAHEAIRPTSVGRLPSIVKSYLSKEQYSLYNLIWQRTIASQMMHATIDTVQANLACGSEDNIFRANGSTIAKPGFILVYQEGKDDSSGDDDEKLLPPLKEGQEISLEKIIPEQHFTEPPPRFTEASLVKSLEEFGIGRPSTYATIISTLLNREYVVLDKKRFQPTDVGRIVNKFLTKYFTNYVNYDFTANLEDELDAVARGEKEYKPLLEEFWQPFKNRIDDTNENVKRSDVTSEAIEEKCPKCGKGLSIRLGKAGRFIGCDGYPDCDYTRNLNQDGKEPLEPEIVEGRSCPKCSSNLVIKNGRYGKFIGCSAYPKCNHMEPLEKPEDTGVACPQCKKGTILKRKSKRGKIFFSCSEYPKCNYAIWNQPLAEACPKCGWPILSLKTTKSRGDEKVCPQKECNFIEPA